LLNSLRSTCVCLYPLSPSLSVSVIVIMEYFWSSLRKHPCCLLSIDCGPIVLQSISLHNVYLCVVLSTVIFLCKDKMNASVQRRLKDQEKVFIIILRGKIFWRTWVVFVKGGGGGGGLPKNGWDKNSLI
jgi:hypothetical protein